MIKKFLILSSLFLLANSTFSYAQNKNENSNSEYENSPKWVKMMNDPNSNFFETVKAFREFWKERELPKEPFENEEMESFEKEVGLIEKSDSEKERLRERKKYANKLKSGKEDDYASEVRAFKGWYFSIQPWVRQDGSIIGVEERQKIIDAQHNELKEIELKDKKN